MLFGAGLQVPGIALGDKETTCNDIDPPEQIGGICVKFGTTFGLTVIVIVVMVAQSPDVGVNV